MEFVSDSGDKLDPRIQIELENLNNATEDINKLESELDEANSMFKKLLSEFGRQREEFTDKIGLRCIDKARCWYEAVEEARLAQMQCQQQAQLFRRASDIHAAAKKTAALAESRCMSNNHEQSLDSTWQDMLNHATTKVMSAANQKAECEKQHRIKALGFHNARRKSQQLEKKYDTAIMKARPYFEMRTIWNEKLSLQKQQVECLQKAVRDAKRNYSKSFRALEDISNEIHEQRRDYVNGPREPGVGAELLSPAPSLSYEAELTKGHEQTSAPKHRHENINNRLVDGSETTLSQWEIECQNSENKLNASTSVTIASGSSSKKSKETFSNGAIDSRQKLPIECQTEVLKTDEMVERLFRASTESPVNSISEQSNILRKCHLSKSMSDIPINIDFEFGVQKNKSDDRSAIVD